MVQAGVHQRRRLAGKIRRAPLETRDAPRGGAVIRDRRRDLATDHMNRSHFRQGITTSCYAALDVARLYSGLRRAEVTPVTPPRFFIVSGNCMDKPVLLTRDGLAKLEHELEELRT